MSYVLNEKALILFNEPPYVAESRLTNNDEFSFDKIIFSISGDPLTLEEIRYPCVVKASLGEDTKAVRLVKGQEALHKAIEHALFYSDHVIIERYKFRYICKQACLLKSRLYKALLVNLTDTFVWDFSNHCFAKCWLILQVH